MAEAENQENTMEAENRGKRRMNQAQLQIMQDTVDWRGDVVRGVARNTVDHRGDLFNRERAYEKSGIADSNIPQASQKDLSLMYCKLKGENAEELFQNVSNTVQSLPNVDPTVDIWAIMGNVYDHGNHCEFLVGMYEVEKQPVLDFKRMSGDGFVMDGFYQKVKKTLKEKQIIDAVEDDDADFDDYSDDFSEEAKDGEEDGDHLTSYGYLQLAYDENIVTSWIAKIEVRHVEDQNHMMGLMAYNASDPTNLEIIVSKGGEKLKNLTIKMLEESNNAALVRNTTELAKKVTSHEKCKEHGYDEAYLNAVFSAMQWWVPNNGRKSKKHTTSFEITESRETVNNLIQTIYNLKSIFSEDIIKEKASRMDIEQKKNVISFLEGKESKTKADDFLLHILKQI